MIANIVAAYPQSPRKFSSVLVTEVDNVDPETKRAFGNGARSVLYSSLPEFSLDLSNFEVYIWTSDFHFFTNFLCVDFQGG